MKVILKFLLLLNTHVLNNKNMLIAEDLFNAIQIPSEFSINSGRHGYYVDGIYAFLYCLHRYHKPVKLEDDQNTYGSDYSVLSKIFNTVVNWIDDNHSQRLRCLRKVAHKFPLFNQKIIAKIRYHKIIYILKTIMI
jgi:hypothetical protein